MAAASGVPRVLRYLAIGAAALCAGCQNPPATSYELVGVDPVQFQQQYAKCQNEQYDYLATYGNNPLDPTSLFDQCMRHHGFLMNRPKD
jgi:hypothetical protein